MIKKISIRKIIVSSLALFTLLLIYIMPDNKEEVKYSLKTNKIDYIYNNNKEVIYTLDKNNYIARTKIKEDKTNIEEKIKNIINTLIIDGTNKEEIPNGFRGIIPAGTEIINLNIKDKTLTINFSKEILEISKEYEEKMIESIIYSLTALEEIENIIIKVEGKTLKKLPNSNKILPEVLDRKFGINKKYNISKPDNIDSYTVYYVSKINNEEYYVPVTKYINDNKIDKINVIINELKTSPIYEENLMSFLNKNTKLINYNIENDKIILNFDDTLYNNSNKILEEVVYTICLSLKDNYNIKEVIFEVNNEEIYKKNIKTIE